jgi:hypothetical protein
MVDMGMSNNNDLTLAQASFQLSPQAQQNAKAKMLKSGSSVVCSSRTPQLAILSSFEEHVWVKLQVQSLIFPTKLV